ncbi:MAG: DUF917 domain-containing protein [Acidobacteria bacterium]|nr:DUF917 domain-containing protein [Acidobacteriota bacterium]
MVPALFALTLLAAGAPPATAQPKVRALGEQDLVDMMQGSSIQATRGSNTQSMVRRVKELVAQGHKFTMIAVEDVPDDWTVASGGGIGGGGGWEYVRERTAKQKLPTIPSAQTAALQALSAHLGKKFNAVVRSEAAGATLTALMMAAELGVPIVDACKAGRARPEGSQSIQWINGIPNTPIAYASRWGDIVLIDKVVDGYRQEDLGRAIAVASGGGASAATAMAAKDLKRGLIAGSLSEAITLGRTVREAREQGRDPIAALVKVTNGHKLFQGIVTASEDRGERGFSWSDVEIRGTNEFAGHTYKVYVKNENIVAWLDGKPDAMSPDFIANLDPKTGDSINPPTLGSYVVNEEVVLIGWPNAPKQWRTPKGIEVFGPRHFGFDFDYVPIEELQKARKLGR